MQRKIAAALIAAALSSPSIAIAQEAPPPAEQAAPAVKPDAELPNVEVIQKADEPQQQPVPEAKSKSAAQDEFYEPAPKPKKAKKKVATPSPAVDADVAVGAPDDVPGVVVDSSAIGQSVSGVGTNSAVGPVNGYVPNRTLSGAKTNTPIELIPQSIGVVGRKEIDDRGDQKVDEALRYSAGVFAQPFGPDSDTNWLFIRGFQATATGVYQDGLQLYSYGFGGFYTDSFGLERVEVLRGASSALYGGSNPGGLVNYVTKRPGGHIGYAEVGVNDAGTAYLGLDFGDALSNNFSYRMTARTSGGDGYSDFQEGWRGFLNPSFKWEDEATKLTLFGSYAQIDENHNGGSFLPYVGTVVAAPFGRIRRDANFTEPDIDTYNKYQGSIGYELEHELSDNLLVRQSARYARSNLHEISVYPFGYFFFSPTPTGPTYELSRINFEHRTSVESFTIDNQVQASIATGPLAHTVLAGVDYRLFNMDQVQASTFLGSTISATNPIYGLPQGTRGVYIDQQLQQQQLGVYLQDQVRFGDGFIVTVSGRSDWTSLDAKGTPAYEGDESKLTGRAGIGYEFANGLVPYASVSTFFNPLIGSSPVAGFFLPESGKQYEVGMKYVPKWMDGLFTVALFDLTRENVVTGPFLQETQIGEVNSRGIELEGKANLAPGLSVTAAYTYIDLEITKDANPALIGNSPYIVPDQQASFSFDYRFQTGALSGFGFGAGVRYVGESWVDNENTLKVPSSTVFDGKLGYDFGDWGIDLNVKNIEDKLYVASCQTQLTCSYGEGRTFLLKAHVNW